MGGQKSEPINLTTETNQSEKNQSEPTSDKLQTTQTNRHRNVLLLSISISLYRCAYLRAYLRAYLCRLFACLYSRINTKRPLRRYMHPPPPYLGA